MLRAQSQQTIDTSIYEQTKVVRYCEVLLAAYVCTRDSVVRCVNSVELMTLMSYFRLDEVRQLPLL